jgi:DNA-binding transcriptional LysR family regulator
MFNPLISIALESAKIYHQADEILPKNLYFRRALAAISSILRRSEQRDGTPSGSISKSRAPRTFVNKVLVPFLHTITRRFQELEHQLKLRDKEPDMEHILQTR